MIIASGDITSNHKEKEQSIAGTWLEHPPSLVVIWRVAVGDPEQAAPFLHLLPHSTEAHLTWTQHGRIERGKKKNTRCLIAMQPLLQYTMGGRGSWFQANDDLQQGEGRCSQMTLGEGGGVSPYDVISSSFTLSDCISPSYSWGGGDLIIACYCTAVPSPASFLLTCHKNHIYTSKKKRAAPLTLILADSQSGGSHHKELVHTDKARKEQWLGTGYTLKVSIIQNKTWKIHTSQQFEVTSAKPMEVDLQLQISSSI